MANYNIDAIYNGNTSLPGTERVRIDSSGNIGIGTATPSTKLHIYENANRVTYISQNNNHTARFEAYGTATAIDTTASNGIFFRINSGDIVKFAADGNVGIGTSTAGAPLHIYRASNPWIRLNGGGAFSYIQLDDGSSYGYLFKNGTSNTNNGALAGAMYTYTDNNKAFQHIHSGTPLFTILSGGNVGIGSVAPTQKLDVAGNINSDNSRTVTYTSVTSGPAGSWYPLFVVIDSTDASVLCNLRSFAHSSVSFIAARGYGPSQTHAVSILNCQQNANGGYANVTGVRIRQSGWVEIQLSWSSGPSVDIGVQIVGSNYVPTFAANLSPTAAVDTIVDTVSLANGMMRSRGNFEAAGGYIAANTTSPARPLTVNGDGTNPCIRLINSTFATSANTALYTFRGWLPIDIGTTKYYLQVFN